MALRFAGLVFATHKEVRTKDVLQQPVENQNKVGMAPRRNLEHLYLNQKPKPHKPGVKVRPEV